MEIGNLSSIISVNQIEFILKNLPGKKTVRPDNLTSKF